MENEATTTPAEETPEESQVEVTQDDTPNDQTNEAPVEVTTETEGEATTEQPVEPATEEDEILNYQPEPYQPQAIDFSKLPTDSEGNVLPEAFTQAMLQRDQQVVEAARQQARQEMLEMRHEEKLWEQATKEYPILQQDKKLRDTVHMIRAGHIVNGKTATPLQAARQINDLLQTARQSGEKQAKESVKIQQSARLETASTQSSGDNSGELMNRIASNNPAEAKAARQALLRSWIDNDKIKL